MPIRSSCYPSWRLGVRTWWASQTGDNGGTCVEIATADLAVVVRDSQDPDGPLLAFARDEWKAFAEQVKADA